MNTFPCSSAGKFFMTVSSVTSSAYALGDHGVYYLLEAGDIGSHYVVALNAELFGSLIHVMSDVDHDLFQLAVNLLKAPAEALAVLAHFQSGSGNAACVGRFSGSKDHFVLLQVSGCFQSGGHVGSLADCQDTVLHQHLSVIQVQLILSRAGKRDITFNGPYASALMVLGVGTILLVLGQSCPVYLFDLFQSGYIDAFRIVYPAVGVRAVHHLGFQLMSFLDSGDGYISGLAIS